MTEKTKKTTAVLLIAHGSRRQQANADLLRVAEAVRERNVYQSIGVAYLEIAEPTILQGADKLAEQGASRILMLPYFLSAGAHVVDDLERFRRELTEKHPDVTFELCSPLGLDPLMIDLILKRLEEKTKP